MELPKFGGKKKEDYFVSFVVGNNWIQAGIWNVEGNRGTLISAGTSSPWQEDNPKSFVEGADDSLSSAIGTLVEEPQLDQVVFGLPFQWVENGKVKQEKLGLLKNLCDTLELKPSGFVVIPEALVFSIKQKEEGAGASFVLVGLQEDEIEITLVASGKIVNTAYVSRSIALGDDIAEGLTRFGGNNLPARIILYNNHAQELVETKNQLSTWEWPPSFFLHTPRIEALPEDSMINAVSEAGAVEVAHVTKFTEEVSDEAEYTEQEESAEAPTKTQVVEEEMAQSTEEDANLVTPRSPSETETTENDMPSQAVQRDTALGQPEIETDSKKLEKPGKFLPSPIALPQLPNLIGFLPLLRSKRPKGPVIILGIFLLGILGALILLPRANATIYLNPQRLEDRLDVIVSPTHGENGKLPGRVISGELTGEKTRPTSGRKTIGDRAKGEMVVVNNTASSRTFATGTVLTGSNGLKFVLDTAITVASESGAPTYKPGETKGNVTAADIGAEYNLAPGNVFSIANFSTSSFSARNDSVFGGGSAREVASVEKTDLEALEKELEAELRERAQGELEPQLGPTEILIPESSKSSIVSRSFSAKVGGDAETLNLRLTVRTDLIAVSKEQLEAYIRAAIASKIPTGLELQSGHIKVNFTPKEEQKDDNGIEQNFSLNVVALLLPAIDKKELAGKVSGKSLVDAQKVFANLPGFVRSTIKLSPSLPGPLNRFPLKSSNIILLIQPEE